MRTQRRRHRAPGAVLGAAVACAIALSGCSGGSDSVDQAAGGNYGFVKQKSGADFVPVSARKTAPRLKGDNLTGGTVDLAGLRGKIVVVNFWASWCAPCREETPGLVALAKAEPSVAFLGVNEKDGLSSAAKAFVRDQHVTYPSVVDRIGTLAAHWPVPPGLPSTFVLDAQGRIAARFTGPVQADEDLKPVIARLKAET